MHFGSARTWRACRGLVHCPLRPCGTIFLSPKATTCVPSENPLISMPQAGGSSWVGRQTPKPRQDAYGPAGYCVKTQNAVIPSFGREFNHQKETFTRNSA